MVSIEEAARLIFTDGLELGENAPIFVESGEDFDRLQMFYGSENQRVEAVELDTSVPRPQTDVPADRVDALLVRLLETRRDDTPDAQHETRLETELDFFSRQDGGMRLLCEIETLIERFKADGVVWGGRGSSCASYVLFLLEVHDINPIKYDIPFYEFSKEF